MRVGLVSEHASPLAALGGVDAGGQNVHVAALARELGRAGHEVTVYTRRDDEHLPRVVTPWQNVAVVHVDAGPPAPVAKDLLLPWMGRFAEVLARMFDRRPPDIVHSHFWMSGLASVAAAAPLGIPVVHTFHALGVVKRRHQGAKDTSPPERLEIERGLLADCAGIVATCTDELFELVRLGADPEAVRVVPCGVELERFRPVGAVAARDPDRARILVVSRLVERKGIGNVIEALADVQGAELLVAGGPPAGEVDADPEVRRLREIAGQCGVEQRVRFLGAVGRDAMPALMRSADVVASVPWYEPFGIVPVEAMACGVPVVASAVGGLADTVVDGETGVHVPPRAPERIAEALRDLLGDAALRRRLGAAGARRAAALYGWPRVAARTVAAYAAVTHAAPARETVAL